MIVTRNFMRQPYEKVSITVDETYLTIEVNIANDAVGKWYEGKFDFPDRDAMEVQEHEIMLELRTKQFMLVNIDES